jgi:pyridoxamine 5'-phosphate oxidase
MDRPIKEISAMRENYDRFSLEKEELLSSPIAQFAQWFNAALQQNVLEANAMVLATATADGLPSARVMLLKGYDERGFSFYTNYGSAKSRELSANPRAALVFNWLPLQRQVRIVGKVEKVGREESEAYFQSRPKDSQIGAYASHQSEVLQSREELEKRTQALEERFANMPVLPLPDNWGGWLLRPTTYEFWQGRPSRLHDRFRYALQADGTWRIDRLSP